MSRSHGWPQLAHNVVDPTQTVHMIHTTKRNLFALFRHFFSAIQFCCERAHKEAAVRNDAKRSIGSRLNERAPITVKPYNIYLFIIIIVLWPSFTSHVRFRFSRWREKSPTPPNTSFAMCN